MALRRSGPAADRPFSTDAGKSLEVPEQAAAPEATPARPAPVTRVAPVKAETIRQTLDMPAGHQRFLQDYARDYARQAGFHPREFNVQRLLREVARRLVEDPDLLRDVAETVRRDVEGTRGT